MPWLTSTVMCAQVPGEDDEVDEETMEELQNLIEADYEV